ncbi:5-oxoprolinase subunit PxpB [Pseudoalteromonas rhizosphaerae]|uniref:5-oxoprolinase subunit PxpB n=1 Tax=Pseudoalteromonas rhizosphaerae TaxID=2518973 RepID=A0ABW8L1L1_9GAMM
MDQQTISPTISVLSNSSILLDATALNDDSLSIQKKIWALVQQCNTSDAFIDVVPAMNSLTVYLIDPTSLAHWQAQLALWWANINPHDYQGKHHKIITQYGGDYGPDLDYVAEYHNLSPQQVIDIHSQGHYQVLFLGFQPGFAYLHGLNSQLHTPRRAQPRTRVPKGSVAIGANQTAIYPADSPGGWHIIGHSDFALFDSENTPPCAIQPGDTLQFITKESVL